MDDKTLVERLREHRVILKSGDYDGAQLMRAWCDMINAADTIEAQATRIEALEAALQHMAKAERDRIVAWLREMGSIRGGVADAIEAGEHAALESQP